MWDYTGARARAQRSLLRAVKRHRTHARHSSPDPVPDVWLEELYHGKPVVIIIKSSLKVGNTDISRRLW